MREVALADKSPTFAKNLEDLSVGVLDVLPLKVRYVSCELSRIVNRARNVSHCDDALANTPEV